MRRVSVGPTAIRGGDTTWRLVAGATSLRRTD